MTAYITFLGAAQQVTGSCYLLSSPVLGRILLDCGLRQGGDDIDRKQMKRLDNEIHDIDAVIISHAHLDHSGLLPKLVASGYEGPIYCTDPTVELLDIMLHDSVHLYTYDLKKENIKRLRRGQRELDPDYTKEDVLDVLEACVTCAYGQTQEIRPDVHLTFHDAGHILGSSIVEVQWREKDGRTLCLVFSGDLGNKHAALMNDPTFLDQADIVMMEGTYGNRNHRSLDETLAQFEEVLHETWERGGNVMIPSFAVGRTQELLYHLGRLHHLGRLDPWQVYLDSPMAIKVTALYDRWLQSFDEKDFSFIDGERPSLMHDLLPALKISESAEESMAINDIQQGAIIIAGSGMCTGGRIRHHFKQRIWNHRNTIVFAGFQARGTLGRILVDGSKHIKLFGEEFIVNAQIETLGGFSAHAGQAELLEWASNFRNNPLFVLVHGEEEALETLGQELHGVGVKHVQIPKRGEKIVL